MLTIMLFFCLAVSLTSFILFIVPDRWKRGEVEADNDKTLIKSAISVPISVLIAYFSSIVWIVLIYSSYGYDLALAFSMNNPSWLSVPLAPGLVVGLLAWAQAFRINRFATTRLLGLLGGIGAGSFSALSFFFSNMFI